MDPNPYTFNRNAQYSTGIRYLKNLTAKDLQEIQVQVIAPQKTGRRGDFSSNFQDLFSKYKLPHITSDKVVSLWRTNQMGFYQNQVNFSVWCATTGCGVSWRDHLNIDRPLAKAVYHFHVYYQVRRILEELTAPLPQDQAWSPFQNPFNQRAYERICREFGLDPATDWHQKVSESGGLGTVYKYSHGYEPVGSFNKNNMRFQSDSSLSPTSNLWSKEHVSYIAQGNEADEAWSTFVLEISQGYTAPGVARLNDSIRTYVWAILGAQAQTRSGILGSGTSFDAQKQFQANVEDAISAPVDIPSAIQRYQDVLHNASSKVDYVFGEALYMAPSDMRLHIGTVVGYNNDIVVATEKQSLGINPAVNISVDEQIDTPKNTDGKNHITERTSLVTGLVVMGLVSLWLLARRS